MGAGLMSGVSGSQRARSCGLPGLWRRRWGLGSVLRPIVRVGYGWGQICGCPAGPKFSSSATAPRAMLGVAGRYQDLLRRRSRVAPTQPELSVLLSAADPRRRRSATARVRGAPAWWLWGTAHIAFLIGMRNRFTVLATWLWAYLTFRGSSRLITGGGA